MQYACNNTIRFTFTEYLIWYINLSKRGKLIFLSNTDKINSTFALKSIREIFPVDNIKITIA